MTNHQEQELDALKQKLLTMGSLAERSVKLAMQAVLDRDDDKALDVINGDNKLDDLEKEIDETAINLLAKAPLATDLRLITVSMKFGHDLERVGDEATTIGRRAIELSQEPQLKPYVDLPSMAKIALEMLDDALSAFVNKDTTRARAVVPRDKDVDLLNKQLQRELSSYMVEKPSTISRCLNLMTISKAIERIADHAANIAEEVVYLYEARDIRHEHKKAPAPSTSPDKEQSETADQ